MISCTTRLSLGYQKLWGSDMKKLPAWLLATNSIVCAYLGIVALSILSCNRAIDPQSADPLLPAFLLGSDVVDGLGYGIGLAIVLLFARWLVRRYFAQPRRLTDGVELVAPALCVAIILGIIIATHAIPATGCRP